MLKKILSALSGKGDAAEALDAAAATASATQAAELPIKHKYTRPWCEVHDKPLTHVERPRPLKGTRVPQDGGVSSGEGFLDPTRTIFPHARPSDPWVTHYDYCHQCDLAKLQWKQTTAAEAKREAEAVERLKKKRHWQDD